MLKAYDARFTCTTSKSGLNLALYNCGVDRGSEEKDERGFRPAKS
jgi:hypothetical protein